MKPTDSKVIAEKMIRYLDAALPIKSAAHQNLKSELERFQKAEGEAGLDFIQPPFVEVAPEYQSAKMSLAELCEKGMLTSETMSALSKDYWECDPERWHLYAHQYRSLEAMGHYDGNENPKNLVICTGTGSGKTESFLIPIVDAIIRERKAKGTNYESHVRALILYPMNALVNDQIVRLRRLLKNTPVTFGKYINIQETKQRATSVSTKDWSKTWTTDALARLPKVAAGVVDDIALPNEYRYRNEWRPTSEKGGRGPADILITNFSMLERLMLSPDTKLFDDPWQFIVLDEAHSYTGSTGTEIAWLMRRLEHRLATNAAKKNKECRLQYVAASATLSDSEVYEEKVQSARKFAKEIFPIGDDDSIAVEFGGYEKPVDVTSIPLPEVDGKKLTLIEFAKRHADLVGRTKEFEEKKTRAAKNPSRIAMLKVAIGSADPEKCVLSASSLFGLQWFFKSELLDAKLAHSSICVNDAIRCMVGLALCRHSRCRTDDSKRKAWKEFLHDPLLHQPTVGHGEDGVGNRIGVYDIWCQIRDGRKEAISYTVFYYLYLAVADIVRDLESLDKSVSVDFTKLSCSITQDVARRMEECLRQLEEESNSVDKEAGKIESAWMDLLPASDEEGARLKYRERLYAALCSQEIIASFRAMVFKQDGVTPAAPKTFPQIAAACKVSQDDLQMVLGLAGLAVAPNKRKPLVDVKYHQVVRDITDIGIYFEDGDVSRPRVVRTESEYTQKGEKIFTLGLCRDCGQPYVLGYLNECIPANGPMPSSHMYIYRSKTDDYCYLHAFTLTSPEDISNVTVDGFPQSQRPSSPVYINLTTGELSRDGGEGFCVAYWVLSPSTTQGKETFIAQCNRCGNKANEERDVRYGNVTPYESEGLQFKIHLLDAFASCAEPDSDPVIAKSTVGEGRKVLVFSDSRSQASRLALNFDLVKNSDFAAYLALLAVCEYKFDPEEDEEYRRDRDAYMKYCAPRDSQDQIESELGKLAKKARERLGSIPSLKAVIGRAPGFYAKVVRAAMRGMFYPQLLELEGRKVEGEPNRFVSDPMEVAKYLFLRTLQESRRNSLLESGKIKISSKKINAIKDDDAKILRSFCGTGINDVKTIRQTLNEIFVAMVSDRCIYIRDGELPTEVKSNWRKSLVQQRVFLGVVAGAVFAGIVRRHGVQEASVGNWLRAAWDFFRDSENGNQHPLLKEYAREVKRGDIVSRESGYALDFTVLCSDLQVEITDGGRAALVAKVLPFIIEEHTAQINSALGAVYQRAFSEGRINILSCSTTFEMGIDVGGLNNVFLGNLPPSASNYRQRAGRAGRRPGAPAYVLSLASSRSSHDRNYYGNVGELFFGKVQPPSIYLDRPIFAARHLRAEALHAFLEYLRSEDAVANWQKTADFILGIGHEAKYGEVPDDNGKPKYLGEVVTMVDSECGEKGSLCHKHLSAWVNAKRDEVSTYVSGIRGVSDVAFPKHYNAAEDLSYELLRMEGETKYDCATLRLIGSARFPEGDKESTDTKRMALYDRLMAGLYYYGQSSDSLKPYVFDDADWLGVYGTPGKLNELQQDVLDSMTIDVLSSTCILPKYGFPSDIVRLIPQENDSYARGLKLERPLVQGMFEYAPGQTVIANKRIFESEKARFTAWCGATTENGTTGAVGHADNAVRCRNPHCGRVFKGGEVVVGKSGDRLCPMCGSVVKDVIVVTPELFVSKYSRSGGFEVGERRGKRILQPETGAGVKIHVPKLRLSTTEPPSHTMRIVNAGSRNEGFNIRENTAIPRMALYLHEVRTDIAVWEVDDGIRLPETWDSTRVENAFVSAFCALKRIMTKILKVSDRDVEGEYVYQDGHHKFVFFDMASGGGGFVLSALMKRVDDAESATLIKDIVCEALKLVSKCKCQNGEKDPKFMPVTMAEYNTRAKDASVRPAVSCYGCLREYSNQEKHQRLDRFDAAIVLKALLYEDDPCIVNDDRQDQSSGGPVVSPNDADRASASMSGAGMLPSDDNDVDGLTVHVGGDGSFPPPKGFHPRKDGELVPIEKRYYLEGDAEVKFCENAGDVADLGKVIYIED